MKKLILAASVFIGLASFSLAKPAPPLPPNVYQVKGTVSLSTQSRLLLKVEDEAPMAFDMPESTKKKGEIERFAEVKVQYQVVAQAVITGPSMATSEGKSIKGTLLEMTNSKIVIQLPDDSRREFVKGAELKLIGDVKPGAAVIAQVALNALSVEVTKKSPLKKAGAGKKK